MLYYIVVGYYTVFHYEEYNVQDICSEVSLKEQRPLMDRQANGWVVGVWAVGFGVWDGLGFRVQGSGFAPRHRFSDRARQLPLAPARAGVAFGVLGGLGGHAKIIITFVFLKHTITRASMPKS